MKILGIDPGFERIGIAIVTKEEKQKEEVVFSECFKTPANINFEKRLQMIGFRIKEIIKKYKPEILAIESLFLNTNQKTVMKVSEAKGVIIYEAIQKNLKIFEATPPQIKMAICGYGRANKEQMMKMIKLLVNIKKEKKSDDELDAIGIAITASAYMKK